MWISINSIFNQIQLLNTSARQIEMYPADEFFRINEKNSVKTTYLLDENRVVEACRVLIHVCSSKLQFVPTFTVNATAYRPPNLQTGKHNYSTYPLLYPCVVHFLSGFLTALVVTSHAFHSPKSSLVE